MKTKIFMDLTDSQIDLFKSYGHIILSGDRYYNLPQWFKTTESLSRVEVLYEDQLPDNVKLFIRNVSIKQALQRLVDLYTQSPYVKLMEQQWIEAFDDAITALDYEV